MIMNSSISMIGIILIILGILALGYQGFSYTKKEEVAHIGDVQITADKQKTIFFPPILGGTAIVVGLVLVVIGRNRKK
jgi:hypothetical protein